MTRRLLITRDDLDFYNSGSTDQVTVTENSTAYGKYRLRPRVLVDVSNTDTSTSVFGQKIAFPLCVAPAGIQAMAHPDGELATSRACAKRRIHMAVSSFANCSVEDIRAAGLDKGPIEHTMQIYTMQDRAKQERIIKRAEVAGCVAIFLTADSPVLGVRYSEHRNDFRTPGGSSLPHAGKNIRDDSCRDPRRWVYGVQFSLALMGAGDPLAPKHDEDADLD
jgi:(S)-2-hydroxy-acid oxidase